MNYEIPNFIYEARLGQDVWIPFGGIDIFDDNNQFIETVNIIPSQVTIRAEALGISWTQTSGNILADGQNSTLFLSKQEIEQFGKTSIAATLFIQESVNHNLPYCNLIIRIG